MSLVEDIIMLNLLCRFCSYSCCFAAAATAAAALCICVCVYVRVNCTSNDVSQKSVFSPLTDVNSLSNRSPLLYSMFFVVVSIVVVAVISLRRWWLCLCVRCRSDNSLLVFVVVVLRRQCNWPLVCGKFFPRIDRGNRCVCDCNWSHRVWL